MQYCENCHAATNENNCPLCGGKKLREVGQEDFCLVTEINSVSGEILMGVLQENGIKYSALPYGSGVESWWGLPLQNFRIFVPYAQFEKAQSIVAEMDKSQTDELREFILKNEDLLNISPRLEKKYKKKLKLTAEDDFFEYCINLVKNAEKIQDKGPAYVEHKREIGSRYIYCYNGNITLCLNNKTFEIYTIIIG